MRSARLRYRAIEAGDTEAALRLLNQPEVRRYLDARVFPLGMSAEKAFIERFSGNSTIARTEVVFVVEDDQDRLVALSGLHAINWIDRFGEWGIMVTPSFWNQGFGREIAETLQRYAFEELNLHRVWLRVNRANAGAVRCYEKAGFVHEGALRQGYLRNGIYDDVLIMGILEDEYRGRLAQTAQTNTDLPGTV